jgi:hypothetical protein
MKIIDQTPFFNNETGEISILDRAKAMLKYGASWIKECEGQRQVITVLGKVLDKNYTLLRNVMLPGLEASFPFILVGPAGAFVMYVTPLSGMFRAKGDQWGSITGYTFKNEKINLLTRTERMARAVQVFLQRQDYSEIISVDAILLCSDPSVHVDSIRPIIRVVMRDALERFAISIMQARVVLSPISVRDIIERILNPPKPAQPQPAETLAVTGPETLVSVQTEDPNVPAVVLPESQAPAWGNEPAPLSIAGTRARAQFPRPKGLDKKQWLILIVMFVIWCLLMTVFLFLVIKDQGSFLLSLLP